MHEEIIRGNIFSRLTPSSFQLLSPSFQSLVKILYGTLSLHLLLFWTYFGSVKILDSERSHMPCWRVCDGRKALLTVPMGPLAGFTPGQWSSASGLLLNPSTCWWQGQGKLLGYKESLEDILAWQIWSTFAFWPFIYLLSQHLCFLLRKSCLIILCYNETQWRNYKPLVSLWHILFKKEEKFEWSFEGREV